MLRSEGSSEAHLLGLLGTQAIRTRGRHDPEVSALSACLSTAVHTDPNRADSLPKSGPIQTTYDQKLQLCVLEWCCRFVEVHQVGLTRFRAHLAQV